MYVPCDKTRLWAITTFEFATRAGKFTDREHCSIVTSVHHSLVTLFLSNKDPCCVNICSLDKVPIPCRIPVPSHRTVSVAYNRDDISFLVEEILCHVVFVIVVPWLGSFALGSTSLTLEWYKCHTHCEAVVQLACTIIGLISQDAYLGERAAVPVLQCCLATSCITKSSKKLPGVHGNCTPWLLLSYAYALWYKFPLYTVY